MTTITSERVKELEDMIDCDHDSYLCDDDKADLHAIFADYEKARPLIEAAMGAELLAYTEDDPFFSDADNGAILRAVLKLREEK